MTNFCLSRTGNMSRKKKTTKKQERKSKCMPEAESFYAKITPIAPPTDGGPPVIPPDLIIWGPGDPRPTLPIAGWDPGTGTFPPPPAETQPPDGWWGAGEGSRHHRSRNRRGVGETQRQNRQLQIHLSR